MAAYAKIYGFNVVTEESIRGHEEDYTCLGDDNFLSNAEYAMLEEIMEKDY